MSVGYQFPFQQSSGSVGYFQMTGSELDAVASNLRVLIVTNRGERPMNFDFGCNLREFLFEQLSRDDLAQRVADRILQQTARWMPFVKIARLNVLLHEDDSSIGENEMLLNMSFSIIGRPDQASLTVPVALGAGSSVAGGLLPGFFGSAGDGDGGDGSGGGPPQL